MSIRNNNQLNNPKHGRLWTNSRCRPCNTYVKKLQELDIVKEATNTAHNRVFAREDDLQFLITA